MGLRNIDLEASESLELEVACPTTKGKGEIKRSQFQF